MPIRLALLIALVAGGLALPRAADGAKATECTKVGTCYCVNDEQKPAIAGHVERLRGVLAAERKAGKAVGYLSVPLSPAGGGNFDVNAEVAKSAKAAVETRFGADYVYVLDPGATELAKGTGADYMLLWTSLLEGTDGLGEVDFVYFAGPQDFARFFGFDGVNDMAKLDAFYDRRVAANPGFAKAVDGGLTKAAFRRYYGLRASAAVSRGAHDEWNIVRVINERRRADARTGPPGQVAVLFDGRPVAPAEMEAALSDGYAGRCAP